MILNKIMMIQCTMREPVHVDMYTLAVHIYTCRLEIGIRDSMHIIVLVVGESSVNVGGVLISG